MDEALRVKQENGVVSVVPGLTEEQKKFIQKWSPGALFLIWIYFFSSGLIREGLLMLVPFYNIYLYFEGIFHGRRMSWEKGEWRDFSIYEKRQKLLDKIGIIYFGIIFILGVAGGATFYYFNSGIYRPVHSFLGDIRSGQIEVAYSNTAKEFQEETSLGDFKFFVENNPAIKNLKDYSINSFSVESDSKGSTGKVEGSLSLISGEKSYFIAILVKDEGRWKIFGFEINSGPGSGKEENFGQSAAYNKTFVFDGKIYEFKWQRPDDDRQYYYEFAPKEESIDDWKNLVTIIHNKKSSSQETDPLVVFNNTLDLIKQDEGFVYNKFTQDDKWIITFVLNNGAQTEASIEKIFLGLDGAVTINIYARKIEGKTDKEIEDNVNSFLEQTEILGPQFINFQFPEPWEN